MKLNWETGSSSKHKEFDIYKNPIARKIIIGKNNGTPLPKIIDLLIREGYEYKDIRAVIIKLRKVKVRKALDWRSPTSINETGRMIRNDIRRRKISYRLGMRVLLKAREMLSTMVNKVKGDMRLAQINHEIMVTKRLLMRQYADKDTLRHFGHRV